MQNYNIIIKLYCFGCKILFLFPNYIISNIKCMMIDNFICFQLYSSYDQVYQASRYILFSHFHPFCDRFFGLEIHLSQMMMGVATK